MSGTILPYLQCFVLPEINSSWKVAFSVQVKGKLSSEGESDGIELVRHKEVQETFKAVRP